MKLNKHMVFYTDYSGTKYAVYTDDKNKELGKYCLVDMDDNEIIKRANKVEKLDKVVYGG